MENASKALIIAGAILVAILLISIGVIVINSTGNMQDQVKDSSDSMAIQTFNAQFTPYEGDDITPSQLKQLKNIINSNHGDHTVSLKTLDNTGTVTDTDFSGAISNTATYTVVLHYDDNGYVDKVGAKVNTTTTTTTPAGT